MSDSRPTVLGDHRRRGSVFQTPFNRMLPQLDEISWVRTILPEVLWIALAQSHLGFPRGPDAVSKLASAARRRSQSPDSLFFSAASSYARFSTQDWAAIRTALSESECLAALRVSVAPLVASFPECPLMNLYTEPPAAALEVVKGATATLLDRSSRDATLVQATVVVLGLQSGQLLVNQGAGISQLRHIEDYPNTEISRRAAASTRAALNLFFGSEPEVETRATWRSYFWNRGIALEPCEFAE